MCDGERGTHLAWTMPPAGRRRAHRVSRRAERRTAGGEAAVRGATGGAGDTAAAAAAARERSDDGWLAATVPFAAPRVRACGRRSFRNVEDYACVIVCSAQSPLLFCRRRSMQQTMRVSATAGPARCNAETQRGRTTSLALAARGGRVIHRATLARRVKPRRAMRVSASQVRARPLRIRPAADAPAFCSRGAGGGGPNPSRMLLVSSWAGCFLHYSSHHIRCPTTTPSHSRSPGSSTAPLAHPLSQPPSRWGYRLEQR